MMFIGAHDEAGFRWPVQPAGAGEQSPLRIGTRTAPAAISTGSQVPDKGDHAMLQVVIANRLRDGLVVFLGNEKKWVERVQDCAPAADDAAAARLAALGEAAEANQEVIGAALIEVEDRDGVLIPIKMREAIRAHGPTVRKDLGKQAGN